MLVQRVIPAVEAEAPLIAEFDDDLLPFVIVQRPHHTSRRFPFLRLILHPTYTLHKVDCTGPGDGPIFTVVAAIAVLSSQDRTQFVESVGGVSISGKSDAAGKQSSSDEMEVPFSHSVAFSDSAEEGSVQILSHFGFGF